MSGLLVQAFHCEASTHTAYLLYHPRDHRCAIIDPPEQDIKCWEAINDWISREQYGLSWILHTTPHPDQIESANAYKRNHVCAQSACGEGSEDADLFDRTFPDGARIDLGHSIGWAFTSSGNDDITRYQFGDFHFIGNAEVVNQKGAIEAAWGPGSIALARDLPSAA